MEKNNNFFQWKKIKKILPVEKNKKFLPVEKK